MGINKLEVGKSYSHPALSGYFYVVAKFDNEFAVIWSTKHGNTQARDYITATGEFLKEAYEYNTF